MCAVAGPLYPPRSSASPLTPVAVEVDLPPGNGRQVPRQRGGNEPAGPAMLAVLFEGIDSWASTGSRELLDQYSDRALQRIWKAQNFSYWMTSMLHERPETNPFDRKRQLGELSAVVNSIHRSAYLAETYTGWPSP